MDRSEKEIRLRDLGAEKYDSDYFLKGAKNVDIEDCSIISALDLHENENFLDVGCGTGRLTSRLSNYVKDCYGIDLSPKSIEVFKNRNCKNVHLSVCDIVSQDIPFHMKYDKILSMQMIQHIEPSFHEVVLSKLFDSLKEGGVFVSELFNYDGYNRRKKFIRKNGYEKIEIRGDFYEYHFSPDEYCSLLEKIGFKIVSCYGICNIPRWIVRMMPERINKYFEGEIQKHRMSKRIGYYFIAICTK